MTFALGTHTLDEHATLIHTVYAEYEIFEQETN